MPFVRTRLGDVIDVGTCQSSVFAGVTVVDDSRLIDVILAKKQVRRSAVVKVQKRIILVHTVNREEV